MNVQIIEDETGTPERVYAQIVLGDATVEYAIPDVLKMTYENVKRGAEEKLGAPAQAGRVSITYEAVR